MKLALLAIVALALVGCTGDTSIAYRREIPPEKRAEAAEWITRTVQAACPDTASGDYEGDDPIEAARAAAMDYFGSEVPCLKIETACDEPDKLIPVYDLTPEHRKVFDRLMAGAK